MTEDTFSTPPSDHDLETTKTQKQSAFLDTTTYGLDSFSISPDRHIMLDFKTPNLQKHARALVDSGASSNFIDINFARDENISLIPRPHTPLTMINGHGQLTNIMYETVFQIKHCGSFGSFWTRALVTDLSTFPVVLGIPWLQEHDPYIDWKAMTIDPSCLMPQPVTPPIADHSPMLASASIFPTGGSEDAKLVPSIYHSYLDVFSKKLADKLPEHRSFDHRIPVEDGKHPPYGPIYSLSDKERLALREYLDDNIAKGFIVPSESPAAAPILFVKKKDGTLRLCVDYRGLNKITIKNRYPLPLISDLLDRLRVAKVYTKIDLRGAYNLLRIAKGEEWKTAFRTRYGLFEYKVMPFGLTNAPASFQHLMNHNFRDMLDQFVICYLDDILIYSPDLDTHQKHVEQVLARLRSVGLYAKAEKCEFHTDKVEFLGFVATPGGITMDQTKVQTVLDWPTPGNLRDVRAFLGFANFYRRFIRSYSSIAHPLTQLTRKELTFAWTSAEQYAFDTLKAAFTSADLLRHFDPDLPLVLETDASDYAVAGILSHPTDKGDLRPIAFLSRKMNSAELNYEIHDKEMLAIIACFKEWRHYLEGAASQTTVYTDHRSLEYFTTSKQLNRRQARWSEFLADFNFVIKYRPGVQGTKPDSLTRRSDYHPGHGASLDINANPQNFRPLIKEDQYLGSAMSLDITSTISGLLLDSMKDDEESDKLVASATSATSTDGLHLDKDGLVRHGTRFFVPNNNDLRLLVTRNAHDHITAGHPGRRKTIQLVQRHYWWPGMKSFVNSYVETCDVCNRTKTRRHLPFGELKSLPVPPFPWSSISMDLIEFLPSSNDMNSILVVVDRLTKMAIFIPTTTSLTAGELAQLYVTHVFSKHGLPNNIISDRGSEFTSSFWKSFTKLLSIDSNFSTAFHPETDGQTERVNQVLEQYLRCYTNYQQTDWCDLLPLAEFAYNSAPHSSTTVSPFFANKGFDPPAHFAPLASVEADPNAHRAVLDLSAIHDHLKQEIRKAQEASAKQFDKHRLPSPTYNIGDKVWLASKHIKTTRPTKKLDNRFLGPFDITEKISSHAYRLALPETMPIHDVFHVQLLEPHIENTIPNRTQSPPPVVIVDGEEEYEVGSILDHKFDRRRRDPVLYYIQWKGHNEFAWFGQEDLQNSLDLLNKYKSKHDLQ